MKQETRNELSSMATAYIMEAAQKMAYTAIRTVYSRSAQPYVLELLQAGWAASHDNARTRQRATLEGEEQAIAERRTEFIPSGTVEETITDEYGNEITTERQRYVPVDVFAYRSSPYAMQETVTRKRKRDGITVKVDELEFTEHSREILDIESPESSDFSDCVSVATLELLELVDKGVIFDFASVWAARLYVYRAVNRYLHGQRKSRAENQRFHDYCVFTDDDGNETVYVGKEIEKRFEGIDTESIVEAISSYLLEALPKKANKANIIATFRLYAIGFTQTEIATGLHITQQAVSKYLSVSKRLLDTPKAREALYALLNR